jgi:capsular polysaccharide biosynthesis protein
VGPERIIRGDRPLLAGSVVLASVNSSSGFVRRENLDRIRRAFPHQLEGEGPRIYVSRRKDTRAMENEAEIESAMRGAGVEVIYAQDLSFAEQRAMYAAAETVVGPHGSGLANIIWSTRGTRIVELFPAEGALPGDCYARLSVALGLTYAGLEAAPSKTHAGIVEVDALLECLAGADGLVSRQ